MGWILNECWVLDSNQPVVSSINPLVMTSLNPHIYEMSVITIPCKPTWNGVEVQLLKEADEVK